MISKIIYRLIAVLLLIISTFLCAQDSTIVPGNIIVMVNSDEAANLLVEGLSVVNGVKTNIHLKSTLSKKMHIYLLEFDRLSVDQEHLLKMVLSNPLVKIAQYNHNISYRSGTNVPNDSLFSQQWNMNNTGITGGKARADVDALKAWNITTGGLTAAGDTIVVAIVDGGFDINHKDLNFWVNHHEIPHNNIDDDNNGYVDDYRGWNPQTGKDSVPVQNHGTHLCGIVGAKGNNTKGVAGVNWAVKIMVVSTDGQTESNVVAAYSYIMEQRRQYNQTNGAKGGFVVSTNSSFGINLGQPSQYPLWCAMYDSLGSVGILSAAATADNNINVDTQGDIPTACPSNWLITVTNTTNTDTLANNSGYGATTIDLGAPGTNIASTIPYSSYGLMSGTSMASPHIAGAVALMYSVGCAPFMKDCKSNPAATALMIKDSLLQAVDKIASMQGITVSGGRLNLYKAVETILNRYPPDSCTTNPTRGTGTGIETYNTRQAFEIMNTYPNPASTGLTIVFNSTESCSTIEATITNIVGQTVQTTILANSPNGLQNTTIELSSLTGGVYLLQLNSCTNKSSNVTKVVVYR